MENSLIFKTENGEEITFYIEEETKVNGISYLLVSDSQEENANAYILKEVSSSDSPEAEYVMVEDDTEFDAIAGLFGQMLEDTELLL